MIVKHMISFGHGYTARSLAAHPDMTGVSVLGTRRTISGAAELEASGARGVLFPSHAWSAEDLSGAWLISIPPDDEGCPVFRALGARASEASWIGFLSSTGVYGDLGGGWAFEETPIAPLSVEAKRRAIAEKQWLEVGAHVFRLPGIYGPGRSAFDRLRAGRARRIVKPGQVFSRAHVDDIADALARSIANPNRGRIYNVADDAPGPPQDVIAHAADLLGVTPPPEIAFEDANLPVAAQRFYSECKRVSNARLKAELGWSPIYKTYHQGLPAVLQKDASI
ncbi:MAG: SDR family oxidoreductase [Pseudomonadota bacterium]